MPDAVRQPSLHDIAPASHPMRRAGDHEPPPPLHPGWTPAHDDASPKAADERARAALRANHETRIELGDVKVELAEIARSLGALVRVLKALGVIALPVAIAVVVDLARAAVAWLTTLHH